MADQFGNMRIAEELQRMNEVTSSHLAQYASSASTRVGRTTIVGKGIGAFVRSYFGRRGFLQGKRGLIFSFTAALEEIARSAKEWEFSLRRSEGRESLPPSTEAEVKKLNAKYASWTDS